MPGNEVTTCTSAGTTIHNPKSDAYAAVHEINIDEGILILRFSGLNNGTADIFIFFSCFYPSL